MSKNVQIAELLGYRTIKSIKTEIGRLVIAGRIRMITLSKQIVRIENILRRIAVELGTESEKTDEKLAKIIDLLKS